LELDQQVTWYKLHFRSLLTVVRLGLILSQLLKINGASTVVLAANKGPKTKLAKELEAADVILELDRQDADAQWAQLKKDHPYGFDAVVRTL
jgi:D-arabinitol dehydrogenase (NADP+)